MGFPAACLGAIAVVAALLAPSLWSAIYVYDDLSQYHLALRQFYATAIRGGESFHWLPGLFCGYNLHAEGQVGMYHPWHWLIYRFLQLPIAFNLEVAGAYPSMLLGMYLLLRRWSLDRTAALIGGMTFAFSGYIYLRFVHVNAIGVVAHVPWLCWAIDCMLRDMPGRCRPAWWAGPALALATTSQMLLGHPQFAWYSLLCEGVYASILVIGLRISMRRLPALAVSKALGLLGGAVQILPTLSEISRSNRINRPSGLELDSPKMLGHLVTLLDPYLYVGRVYNSAKFTWVTHEHNFYLGALAPVLLTWLLIRGGRAWRSPLWFGMATLGLAGVMLMLIDLTPFSALYRKLPIVGTFRINGRYYLLVVLAVSVLVASALTELRRVAAAERPGWRTLWPLVVPPMLAAVIVLASWAAGTVRTMNHSSPILAVTGVLLSAAAALLTAAAARGSRPAWSALGLLVAVDLGAHGLSYVWHTPPLELPAVLAKLPDPPPHEGVRVHFVWADDEADKHPVGATTYLLNGTRLIGGYAAIIPQKRLDYDTVEALRVASVGLIGEVAHVSKGDKSVHALHGNLDRWLTAQRPVARVRLVSRTILSDDPRRDIVGLDVAEIALVDRALELPGGSPGSAEMVADRPGQARIHVEAPARRLVVFSESFHAGWQAMVDDRSVPIVPTYGDFLGCIVEAGSHEVELHFSPPGLVLGKILSLAAFAGIATWLALGLLGSRRSPGRNETRIPDLATAVREDFPPEGMFAAAVEGAVGLCRVNLGGIVEAPNFAPVEYSSQAAPG